MVHSFKCFIIFLGTVSIFVSCSNNEKLSGTWIGAYQTHYYPDEPLQIPFRKFLKFEVDSVKIWAFDLEHDFQIVKYELVGNEMLIYSSDTIVDTMKITSSTSDTLVFEVFDKIRKELVFKRFHEDPSPSEVDLVGIAYLLKSGNYSDSIEFLSDTLLAHPGQKKFNVERWGIREIGNHKFLVLGQISPPFYLESKNDRSFLLKNYINGDKMIMSELVATRKQSELIGIWDEVSRTSINDDRNFPKPKIKLNFEEDSVGMISGKWTHNLRWRINSTGRFIYFPERLFGSNRILWEIIELTDEKLVIERSALSSWSEAEMEWIEFRRKF